jgi:hypothetical protein
MDIKVGFNNMRASIVHHGGDELCTCGCEAICANLGHRAVVGPIVSCQVAKHLPTQFWFVVKCVMPKINGS